MLQIAEDRAGLYDAHILARLKTCNASRCDWLRTHSGTEAHSFIALDDDRFAGGAVGYVQYNWYFLDLLFVEAPYRGQRIGSALLQAVESLARRAHLTGVRTETWDFQALDFYRKSGFQTWGQLEDCPPGTILYCLQKRL